MHHCSCLRAQVIDDRFDDFVTTVAASAFRSGSDEVFTTDAEGLWEAYLDSSPPGHRQSRTCHTCRSFIRRYGGLVTITPEGLLSPLLWEHCDRAPIAYREAATTLRRMVAQANVTGVFRSQTRFVGTARTGEWTHFALTLPNRLLDPLGNRPAIKSEEYGMLQRGLAEFSVDTIRQAHALLKAGQLPRAEKHAELAAWLLSVAEGVQKLSGKRRNNIVWRFTAAAPVGWCHVKSGLIGTLLEDIQAGMAFSEVKRRFAEKIDPLHYMRPQAAPKAGNIEQAERIVADLGIARSLERRHARLADVTDHILWLPKPTSVRSTGAVFSHLTPSRRVLDIDASPSVRSWEVFARDVLPDAEQIEYNVARRDNFCAYVTAFHADAPLIFQWDNPLSWYVYHNGSPCTQWGLFVGNWHPVAAVVRQPSEPLPQHGRSVTLALKGAADRSSPGLGLFPEILSSKLHPIRATIEAHSKKGKLRDNPLLTASDEVAGPRLQKGQSFNCLLRVTSNGVRTQYLIDRWE